MNKEYLLSIVVPTKNRYKYLKYLIQLIKGFQSDDIELVIQDNTEDNKEILEFIEKEDFVHLRYFHSTDHLSVSQNSDLAILNSTGKYVCFIGDDDGVIRNIDAVLSDYDKKNIDCLIAPTIIYNWPDYIDNSRYKLSGVLMKSRSQKKETVIDTKKEFKAVVDGGFSTMGLLPKVYQAIVKRSKLDEVYKICSTYFPGPSPDMANSIALYSVCKSVYYTEKPLVITGQCKSVGGGERMMAGNLKSIKEIPFLPENVEQIWDKKLPMLWCSDTVWPASARTSCLQMGIPCDFNYEMIYAKFVYHHPKYRNEINDIASPIRFYYYLNRIKIADILSFIKVRISSILSNNQIVGDFRVYRNIQNIIDAETRIYDNAYEEI